MVFPKGSTTTAGETPNFHIFLDETALSQNGKKTDTKSDDVLMPLEIEDSDLLNTLNTLLNDETGEDARPWSDESEKTKILTVLDDPKEVEKGRQKEKNETVSVIAVRRSEAVGKRVIQTRMGRSRERRSCDVQAGSEKLQS